jgi:nicotinamidase-related amidase
MNCRLSERGRSVLVVIDYQFVFHPIVHRNEEVQALLVRTLRGAGIFGVPVILSEHYPGGLGHTTQVVREAYDALEVEKRLIEKTIFSCAGDDGFNGALEALGGKPADEDAAEVILTGIESHVCVLQTALELLERGYRVTALADAITARGAWYARNGIDQMRDAGVRIGNSESILFEWCRHKGHEGFKPMNALLKEMPSPGTT